MSDTETQEVTLRRPMLPTSSDRSQWTEDEAARVEAAGLTFTFPDRSEKAGQTVLAPRPVIEKLLHTAERTQLDPLARQLYCIPRLSRGVVEWTIQTSIDGFRVVRDRARQFDGMEGPQWLTEKGEWVSFFVKAMHGDHPLAARVRIWRKDWSHPIDATATWDEYVQTKYGGEVTEMWKQRGAGQLAKCAEALGLRKAFPQDLSGVYTDDEMASQPLDTEGAPERPGEQRPRAASRAAALAVKPAEEPQAVVVPESTEDAGEGRTASAVAEPDDAGEAEPMEACQRCHRATPVTELLESPGRDLCASCAAEVQP